MSVRAACCVVVGKRAFTHDSCPICAAFGASAFFLAGSPFFLWTGLDCLSVPCCAKSIIVSKDEGQECVRLLAIGSPSYPFFANGPNISTIHN
jgi:hypothetical protein